MALDVSMLSLKECTVMVAHFITKITYQQKTKKVTESTQNFER